MTFKNDPQHKKKGMSSTVVMMVFPSLFYPTTVQF